jgi:tetratricopeptide (TPR) repeat protein
VLSFAWPQLGHAEAGRAHSAEETNDVDDLVTRGIALRHAGEDARALVLFQRADQLQPGSARIRVHLAAAYQALGHWEDADRYLTLALEAATDPYVQKNQAILADARRTIDEHLATLELTGDPPGARVSLNGRSLGTLPLSHPVRVEAGTYTLEVQLDGHYPVQRSLVLAGGALARERVSLAPLAQPSMPEAPGTSASGGERESPKLRWLPWTFAGLAAGAGAGAALAWAARERHVARWNDDSVCLPDNGMTRGQACGAEHSAGDRAETWGWVGIAAAGAFTTASVVSFVLIGSSADDVEQPTSAAVRCGLGIAQLQCGGRF